MQGGLDSLTIYAILKPSKRFLGSFWNSFSWADWLPLVSSLFLYLLYHVSKLPIPAGAVGGELDVQIIGIDVGFAELDFFGVFYLNGEVIDSDPRERTDGDTTTWAYHDTTGLELQKTYADGSTVTKRYGAFNNCTTITDARGMVKTNTYERTRGLLLRSTYNDGATARAYTYNHLRLSNRRW